MLRRKNSKQSIKAKRNEIYFSIESKQSQRVVYDVQHLYSLYNSVFFKGCLPNIGVRWSIGPTEMERTSLSELNFSKSSKRKQITAEQANKVHRKEQAYGWKKPKPAKRFRSVIVNRPKEIVFNKSKFYYTWNDEHSVSLSGLSAHDRLTSLMLVMEHEIIRLILCTEGKNTNPNSEHYKELALQLFGYAKTSDKLRINIGPKKRSAAIFQPTDGWGLKKKKQIRIKHNGKFMNAIIVKEIKKNRTQIFDVDKEKYFVVPFKISTLI